MAVLGTILRGLRVALGLGFLAGAALAQDVRMLDGRLALVQPNALPPGTVAVIEARDVQDRLLAEAVLAVRAAPPIPFALGLPMGQDATLRAAFMVGGRAVWFVDGIEVPAGTEPVALGEIALRRYWSMGLANTLRCGTTEVRAGLFASDAVIEVAGKRQVLRSLRPDRFVAADDAGTWIEVQGGALRVSLAGTELPLCSVAPPAAPQPFRAGGPGWTLDIAKGRLSLEAGGRIEADLPDAAFDSSAFVFALPEQALILRLTRAACRTDSIVFPDRVEITQGGRTLAGCGGDPRELLAGQWRVEDIDRRGLIDASRLTLTFGADGALTGSGGCNRYATTLGFDGSNLVPGAIAATRRQCTEALMAQEQRFFAALAAVRRFDIDDTGALMLYDGAREEPAITARR